MKTFNAQKIAAFFILISSFQTVFPVEQGLIQGKAPSWKLSGVDGKMISSDDFKGKVVIVDFWATWCFPCQAEIPGFVELQSRYKDRGLVVVGVSTDQGSSEDLQSFIKEFKINYPIAMGNEKALDAFGLIEPFHIPNTYVIDRKGNIAGHHIGYTEFADFEREILRLL